MLDEIWRKYAAMANVLDHRPDFRYDPEIYAALRPDLGSDPEALLRHYRSREGAEDRLATFYDIHHAQQPAIDVALQALVTEPDLLAAIEAGEPDAHKLACELIQLGEPVDALVSNFSMKGYLKWHPDIVAAGMDPLHHYLRYGFHEKGRRTLADVRRNHKTGKKPFRRDLPTCMIAVHEMSRTGAPIVGRDLLREAAKDYNVVIAALRGGELMDQFLEHACEVVISPHPQIDFPYLSGPAFESIEFAILNSVECALFVAPLVSRDIPFTAYLHEFADYSFPVWTSTLIGLFADLVIYSSEIVRDSWAGRLKDIEFDMTRDTVIVPQRPDVFGRVDQADFLRARRNLSEILGRDLSKVRLVCGAGHIQWRKGTDIFVMAAQIAAARDPDTVFLWIGDGQNIEDIGFGVWFDFHLRQAGADRPGGNLFFLPAGPHYFDVLKASDAMFLSSRLDPLPNVVFDATLRGCRVVTFENATGFSDDLYKTSGHYTEVEYGNPAAAVDALTALPRKETSPEPVPQVIMPKLFGAIRDALEERLGAQTYFVSGATEIDLPILYTKDEDDRALRVRERQKILRYGRRMLWRDPREAAQVLAASDNWIHKECRIVPYAPAGPEEVPPFSMHIHAYYTDEIAEDLKRHVAYRHARRIVVTTDTAQKGREITEIMQAEGLTPEIRLVSNRGRDILPFMELFSSPEDYPEDEVWCHIHQKKSLTSATGGDIWRRFLMRILLGDSQTLSSALAEIGEAGAGLVAPFEPHFVAWNASRRLISKFDGKLPGPLPPNPLVFPVGNMFWVRRPVIDEMNALFGPDYPWPNEPIANDGTEFHMIERLWPAVTAKQGLKAIFVSKPDEQRI
ncbi:rhamnan synthesis F family protein [Mangrovicoccus algicola]|uniref:Glycosyl transferase n=1 Tax=Mangrovicoccus algicola TaxID=2771008 RepID=A0A8J7CI22_9RHOB|nr:rhamnan synthesis F family protein [Mangrovicoccus algicola]MBE3639045.1 glycosyl transferase [Mangrovicoccus algicola]